MRLPAARLRVETVAYWASAITWSIAARTWPVQALGSGIREALAEVIVFSQASNRELGENTVTFKAAGLNVKSLERKNRWTTTPVTNADVHPFSHFSAKRP